MTAYSLPLPDAPPPPKGYVDSDGKLDRKLDRIERDRENEIDQLQEKIRYLADEIVRLNGKTKFEGRLVYIIRKDETIFQSTSTNHLPRKGDKLTLAKWDTVYVVTDVFHIFGQDAGVHMIRVTVEIDGAPAVMRKKNMTDDLKLRPWREALIERLRKDEKEAVHYLEEHIDEFKGLGNMETFMLAINTIGSAGYNVIDLQKKIPKQTK